ncbi:sigma-70 family RNA polymerase sigma factor [Parapedobacter sp. ISTM3]|uniref:RNA polymerase sigma factor n=1 Tax=Parapedobacter sp. ISTM3 TaxID=2800130 RepID=UPI001904D6D7|nr:sigma-70 family RNA polymerase sigma factor [Parapedobacter sp. ISTM3]MBK1438891.1 sigma-70 family RNA polymerase sigma factor [Parapedobacter sp. ISTM3]
MLTTDEALIDALRLGTPEAYSQLYDRYWKMLYKKAYSRVADEDAAKDIVQDIFISLWQKREELLIRTSLDQFLLGAVKLRVLNHFRSERVKQRAIDQALSRMELFVPEEHDRVSRDVLEAALDEALHGMPENMKQSFLLRCDNLSIREIAEKLGLAEQTVSNNLSEAIKRLKQKLSHQHQGEFLIGLSLFLSLIHH